MPDCFALLDEPRRPWLDADALKEKFHALAAAHHPDVARGGAVDFAALNDAYQKLRDPVQRLRHLLELEAPDALARAQQIPADIAELFMRIGAQRQALDAFLKKQSQAASALAQALLAPEKIALLAHFENLLAALDERRAHLLETLRSLDDAWRLEKSGTVSRLAEVFQSLSFLSKWSDQLREAVLKLTL